MSFDFYTTNNYSDATTVGQLKMPSVFTEANDLIKVDGTGQLLLYAPTFTNGPGSSIANHIPTFSDATGKNLQESSASIDNTGLLTVTSLKAANLNYPTADGVYGSVLTTDGAGNLTFMTDNDVKATTFGIMTTTQTGPIAGDHVKFDTVQFVSGTGVTLDTTTTYTTSPNVASIGRVSLAANQTYKLTANVTQFKLNLHNGNFVIQWYNADTNVGFGTPVTICKYRCFSGYLRSLPQ